MGRIGKGKKAVLTSLKKMKSDCNTVGTPVEPTHVWVLSVHPGEDVQHQQDPIGISTV